MRGTFLPDGGSRRGPAIGKRTETGCAEFSSWYKSYFLNNSSLNTAVSFRYLKPLSMSCFSIMGLRMASCFQTILLSLTSPGEVWKDLSLFYCWHSKATEHERRMIFQTPLSSRSNWRPRLCCSQLLCAFKSLEKLSLAFSSVHTYLLDVNICCCNKWSQTGWLLFILFIDIHLFSYSSGAHKLKISLLGLKSKLFLEALSDNLLPWRFCQ